ncbi:Hypothetical predicted protein [Pelobates cultripes]|uniref:Uncharacterized protein n=1 Tax=Pelobates cultripes TaxID=61616 RepID=A0AAD1RVP6_PELCU|nr:Hypothetical predicted protein [Pelobates cultripes]
MKARIQAVEVREVATADKLEALQRDMARLKQVNTNMENKVAALENSKHQRNLRIRGV